MVTKICIDPGHGGFDPGAVYYSLKEKDLTLKISQKIKEKLLKYNAIIMLTRGEDKTISLTDRVKLANFEKANCFISIHINASTNIEAKGFESFSYDKTQNNKLQIKLHEKISEKWINFSKDRGIKKANYFVLRETNMTAVLLEFGFISNVHDRSILKNDNYMDEIIDCMVDGIVEFYNLEKLVC